MNENIERAMAASAKRKAKTVVLAEATIRITQKAIKVTKSGEFGFTRGEKADPTMAFLLVWDQKLGAYTPVLTPAGTAWELVEKQQGPTIWRPGMST